MPIHVIATHSSTHDLATDPCTPQSHTFAADTVEFYVGPRLLHAINVGVIGNNEVRAAIQLPSSIRQMGVSAGPTGDWTPAVEGVGREPNPSGEVYPILGNGRGQESWARWASRGLGILLAQA